MGVQHPCSRIWCQSDQVDVLERQVLVARTGGTGSRFPFWGAAFSQPSWRARPPLVNIAGDGRAGSGVGVGAGKLQACTSWGAKSLCHPYAVALATEDRAETGIEIGVGAVVTWHIRGRNVLQYVLVSSSCRPRAGTGVGVGI